MLDPIETHETFKEYSKEELYDLYASGNNIPDVIQNYVDELEGMKNIIRKIKALKDIECILNSDQKIELVTLEKKLGL